MEEQRIDPANLPVVEDERGVDISQIRRQLRMTPAERLKHMVDVVNKLEPFRGAAIRNE